MKMSWFKNEETTPEYQDEQQYLQQKSQFEDWIWSNEVRGDWGEALKVLQKTTKVKIENFDEVEDAYFKQGKFSIKNKEER